jgi:hypothetical protein
VLPRLPQPGSAHWEQLEKSVEKRRRSAQFSAVGSRWAPVWSSTSVSGPSGQAADQHKHKTGAGWRRPLNAVGSRSTPFRSVACSLLRHCWRPLWGAVADRHGRRSAEMPGDCSQTTPRPAKMFGSRADRSHGTGLYAYPDADRVLPHTGACLLPNVVSVRARWVCSRGASRPVLSNQ